MAYRESVSDDLTKREIGVKSWALASRLRQGFGAHGGESGDGKRRRKAN
jgi:hypothetical protein